MVFSQNLLIESLPQPSGSQSGWLQSLCSSSSHVLALALAPLDAFLCSSHRARGTRLPACAGANSPWQQILFPASLAVISPQWPFPCFIFFSPWGTLGDSHNYVPSKPIPPDCSIVGEQIGEWFPHDGIAGGWAEPASASLHWIAVCSQDGTGSNVGVFLFINKKYIALAWEWFFVKLLYQKLETLSFSASTDDRNNFFCCCF